MSDLIDKVAITQVLGCIMKDPSLLEEYSLDREDFPELFHRTLFATVSNLYAKEVGLINGHVIDEYLRPYEGNAYPTFTKNNGIEYVEQCMENADIENFKYNFEKVKKFTMLREAVDNKINIESVYNPDCISPTGIEQMKANFDRMTITEMVEEITRPMVGFEDKYSVTDDVVEIHSGKDLEALIQSYSLAPDYGRPFMGDIYTTISRGARLGKFFLTSGSTGSGKTRTAVGDSAYLSAHSWYDIDNKKWVKRTGVVPSLFISTEIPEDDIQTTQVACVSGVSEEKIRENRCNQEEKERINQAIKVIKESDMYILYMPDFGIRDIIRQINKYKRKYGVHHFYFDYIHSSLKIIQEISQSTRGMKISEEMVLRMFSIELKRACGKDTFIHSSTQLNDGWQTGRDMNEGVLRGAKAIADKIDLGRINMRPTKEDLESVSHLLLKGFGNKQPNMISHFFKNRSGKYSEVKVWSYTNLDNCRVEELFMTNINNEIIPMEIVDIIFVDGEEEFNIVNKETGEVIF